MTYNLARITLVALAVLFVAGCDKCGHTINLLAPSLPKACGDNADPNHG